MKARQSTFVQLAFLITFLAASAVSTTAQCDELQKLTAAGGQPGDFYGCAVSMSGDIAVVGAPNHPFAAPIPGPGAVFVYHRQGSGPWQLAAMLTAPSGDDNPGDQFGAAVSIDGDLLAVGAPNDDQLYENSGAVYVFHRNGSSWGFEEKLLPFNINSISLGRSVALWDDSIVAGATYGTTGAAFAYRRDGSQWTEEAHLVPTNSQALEFGFAVALYQDTALIGAPLTSSLAGTAYFFHRTGATWTQQAEIQNPTPAPFDLFGQSVAIQGRWAVVGTPYDSTVSHNTGAAYVYRQDMTGAWSYLQDLMPSDGSSGGHLFGWACTITGGKIVIGAPQAGVLFEGAAYQFNVSGTTWSEVAKYTASDPDGSDWFGYAVGVGNYSLIGAYLDDGIGLDAGAAYLTELCP